MMNNKKFSRLVELKQEIDNVNEFLFKWKIRVGKFNVSLLKNNNLKISFNTQLYTDISVYPKKEYSYYVSDELEKRILNTIQAYLEELEKEFASK